MVLGFVCFVGLHWSWVTILTQIEVAGVGLGHCTATNKSDWKGDGSVYCHKQKSQVGN